jgi:hypothetical protein
MHFWSSAFSFLFRWKNLSFIKNIISFRGVHNLERAFQGRSQAVQADAGPAAGGERAITLSLADFTNTVNLYAAIRDSPDCQPLHGKG